MSERDKIKLEVLEEILSDCKAMYSEYILDCIREKISILKHGIYPLVHNVMQIGDVADLQSRKLSETTKLDLKNEI